MEQRAIRYRYVLCKKSKYNNRTWKHEITVVNIDTLTSKIIRRVSLKKIPKREDVISYLQGNLCYKKQVDAVVRLAKLRQKNLSVVILDDGTELLI